MASTTLSRTLVCPGAATCLLEKEASASRASLFRSPLCPALSSKALFATSPAPQKTLPLLVKAQAIEQDAELGSDDSDGPAGGAPVEGTKLYVGNLPWNVDSGNLAEIFQDAGVVEEVEVICDRDTGRSRGFAFVVMSSPEDAQAALERFDGSDLGGRTLRVNFPAPPGQRRNPREQRDQRGPPRERRFGGGAGGGMREESPNKLYVGNLSWGVDDRALQELFAEFGRVLEARVVMDRETGRSRGFGFVTLSKESEVSSAVSNLDGAEFDGRQLRVNPASQKPNV